MKQKEKKTEKTYHARKLSVSDFVLCNFLKEKGR